MTAVVGADVWETPQEFFDALNAEFRFQRDVCALPCNAKVQEYFTPEADGLRQPWAGTCWMNPPYGRGIEHWIRKAFEESQRGATVVCLVPARTETAWWHDYCQRGEVRFVRGRLWFKRPDGKTGRPRFGSAVVVFRPTAPRQPRRDSGVGLDAVVGAFPVPPERQKKKMKYPVDITSSVCDSTLNKGGNPGRRAR